MSLAVALSGDAQRLAVCAGDNSISAWDTHNSHLIWKQKRKELHSECLDLSPDSCTLVTGHEGCARFWNSETGEELQRYDVPAGMENRWVQQVAFAPNGKTAVATLDMAVYLIEVQTGKELAHFGQLRQAPGASNTVITSTAFSPEAAILAVLECLEPGSGSEEGLVSLFSIPDGRPLGKFSTPPAWSLAFSPSGQFLAIGNNGGVWEVATCQKVLSLPPLDPDQGSASTRFVQRGLTLMTLSDGRYPSSPKVMFWDAFSGKPLAEHELPYSHGRAPLAISKDERRLATAQRDSVALLWDMRALGAATVGVPKSGTPISFEDDWKNLLGTAGPAYRAMGNLVRKGNDAVGFLATQVLVLPPKHLSDVPKLVSRLGSDRLQDRNRAYAALEQLGGEAELLLRGELDRASDLEVRTALTHLIAAANSPIVHDREELRLVRGAQVLEWIGTPKAEQCLSKIAAGPVEARPTRHARAAKARLGAFLSQVAPTR
jgi:WD40 domain-containing protein